MMNKKGSTESTDSQANLNEFNIKLNQTDKSSELVISEVSKFTAVNGFTNIHLVNE